MASGQSLQQQASSLHPRLKTLINNDLKEICRSEDLPVSGVKAALQERIIQLLNQFVQRGDANAIQRLRYRIYNHGQTPPATPHQPQIPDYPDSVSPVNSVTLPNHHRPAAVMNLPPRPRAPLYQPRFSFKSSPFYDIDEALAPTIELQVLPNNRTSTSASVQLSTEVAARLKADSSMRVMLFSAADPVLAPYAAADIAFPHQLEVRVNGDEVKSNFKGLKNKPGSTRPADITDLVRKIPNYNNSLQVTYALTQKASGERKFHMVVYLVRKHSVAELSQRISQVFSKERVINEMISRARDEDIVIESQVVSLRDPVAGIRISMPCRSTVCSHNECFDAISFLQLQEQAPTWNCPICNKTISYEALAVDRYMQDVLDKTSSSTDQARLYPDGTWSPGTADKTKTGATSLNRSTNGVSAPPQDDSDDDLVEIVAPPSMKKEESMTPLHNVNTPPVSSREPSAASAVPGSNRGKRKQEVIDLTLSDDDEPPRPAKRTNSAYSTPNSLPDRPFRLPPLAHNAYPTHPTAPFTRPCNGFPA
ncbi:PINIT domain-containing protein [Macrophomina phaseolina]|uniref:PINIT domain-containing protein n=1 Tax=Macrophomina phaseolina TaxID=35725 RepID=A0ABQ8GBF4_9PEZI|nr:PINIT domain-containing protein [Macrophomina phaseolina]